MSQAREHILSIAFQLFLQKNFKEVTMREIVEKTGMSKGGFYHYFKSKEEVFTEVVNHYFLKMMSVDFDQFSHESLKTFCKDYLRYLTEQSEFYVKEGEDSGANLFSLIFESMKIVPGFRKQFKAAEDREIDGWKKIIKTARKNKEIKSDMTDEQLARLFIFINDGVGIRMIIDGNIKKMNKEIKELWNALYNQVRI